MAENHSNRWIKWVVILGVAIVVIGGGIWYFRHGHQDAPDYQTVAVTRGELTQVVTATGTLNPVVNVTVGSQVSGIINKLNVDYNSMVKSNEVIAEIDPSTYQARSSKPKPIWPTRRRTWNCSRPRRNAAPSCSRTN